MKPRHTGGFTLIEVIIALFVIALGVGALLATLTASADSVAHLREKSLAEWIALNRISEVRLGARPRTGTTAGSIEYAGRNWRWEQTVTDPGIAGILRIDVRVAGQVEGAPAATATGTASATGAESVSSFPALATAYGFVGTSVAPANGNDPDWSLAAAAPPLSGGRQP
jgi:general secretion pathway protein I